jgi:sortase A
MTARGSIAGRPWKSRTLLLRAAYYFFLAGGILGLGYATHLVVDTKLFQMLEESRLPQMGPSHGPRGMAEGDVIGEMKIPRLGLSAVVVQGGSPKILQRAVGHLHETALPGEPGNVALAGHRDSFFRSLRSIQLGDAITIRTSDAEIEYQVESTEVVLPSDVQVLQPSTENILTLVTCFPFNYIGAAPKRFIVRARQIGPPIGRSPIAKAPLHF